MVAGVGEVDDAVLGHGEVNNVYTVPVINGVAKKVRILYQGKFTDGAFADCDYARRPRQLRTDVEDLIGPEIVGGAQEPKRILGHFGMFRTKVLVNERLTKLAAEPSFVRPSSLNNAHVPSTSVPARGGRDVNDCPAESPSSRRRAGISRPA